MADKNVILKSQARTTTLSQGIFALSKSAIGAGTLGLPRKFAEIGMLSGMGTLLLASTLCTTTLHFLARVVAHTDLNSYFALGKLAFGNAGELITMIALVLNIIGALIFYISIAGEYFCGFLKFIRPQDVAPWYYSQTFMMLLTAFLVFPLSSQRDMSVLAKASLMGMVCMGYILILTVFDYFYDSAATPVVKLFVPFGFKTFFSVFSGILFAFLNHFTIIPTVPVMIDATPKRRNMLTGGSAGFIVAFYLIVAGFGYGHFGETVSRNILTASTSTDKFIIWAYAIGQLLMGVVLVLSYPLLLDPCRGTIEGAIAKIRGSSSPKPNAVLSLTLTAAIIAVSTFTAICFPKEAELILQAFTALTGSLIVFIAPAAIFLKLGNRYKVHSSERIIAYIDIAFGFFLMIFGTYYNVADIFSSLQNK